MESETEPRELSAEFVFCCPSFPHAGLLVTSPVLGFLCMLLPPRELLLSRASAGLGLHLVGAKLRLFQPG